MSPGTLLHVWQHRECLCEQNSSSVEQQLHVIILCD